MKLKEKRIFVIVWKTWKNYKILMFRKTFDAWKYIVDHKILSYSVYWSNTCIEHSTSTTGLKEQIEQILRENPEITVNWKPSNAK